MIPCKICGKFTASKFLGSCLNCIKEGKGYSKENRRSARMRLGLSEEVPKGGNKCSLCVNECEILPGEVGYCGIIQNRRGVLSPICGTGSGLLEYYLDPIPTNCVCSPFCPANTDVGFPKYTKTVGIERGRYNLAVFFYGCSLDCFFCQNPEHKKGIRKARNVGEKELVEAAKNEKVSCICYFGGDPGPQAPFSILVSEKILEEGEGIKRICWETNGIENPKIVKRMGELSLNSGGIVKIDWKAFSPEVYEAIAGINGKRAVERIKENCKILADLSSERDFSLLAVSTLLVPEYFDYDEIYGISSFLSSIDPEVPYVLLAFYPTYLASDLRLLRRKEVEMAIKAARDGGLKRIYLGNEFLIKGI